MSPGDLDQDARSALAAMFAGAVRDHPQEAAGVLMACWELVRLTGCALAGSACESELADAQEVLCRACMTLVISMPPPQAASIMARVIGTGQAEAGQLIASFLASAQGPPGGAEGA